jgi:hypothetical protein
MQTEVCRLSVWWRRNKRKLSVCKRNKQTKRTCPSMVTGMYVLRTMRVSVVCLMCDAGVSFVWRDCVLCVMRVCVVCYVSAYFCVFLYIFYRTFSSFRSFFLSMSSLTGQLTVQPCHNKYLPQKLAVCHTGRVRPFRFFFFSLFRISKRNAIRFA